jgi:hypothetical protein
MAKRERAEYSRFTFSTLFFLFCHFFEFFRLLQVSSPIFQFPSPTLLFLLLLLLLPLPSNLIFLLGLVITAHTQQAHTVQIQTNILKPTIFPSFNRFYKFTKKYKFTITPSPLPRPPSSLLLPFPFSTSFFTQPCQFQFQSTGC